jgi:ABC-2 type transport system permease protein
MYLLLGVVLWGFFVDTTSICMSSIVANGDLIRKIYFPRIILPIAMTITSLITLTLNLIVVFGFAAFSHAQFNWQIIFFPALLIEYYLFVLGVSFFLSSMYVRFRDIGPIWEVVAQTLFYATPILYSMSLIPGSFQKIIMLNPAAQIIQDARFQIVTPSADTAVRVLGSYFFIPYLLVLIVFVSGYFLFQKMAARFAEEV